MANIDWFDTFNYAWGQNGNTDAYDEAEYKLGWAFLGNQPPTVEQFNEQGQIWDKKQKWLYDQMKTIADEHGVTVTELDTDLLKNVLLDYLLKWSAGTAAYVDTGTGANQVPINNTVMRPLGTFDASTGSYPTSPTKGDWYRVSVEGTVSGRDLKVDDKIYYDGTAWQWVPIGAIAKNFTYDNGLPAQQAFPTVQVPDLHALAGSSSLQIDGLQVQIASVVTDVDGLGPGVWQWDANKPKSEADFGTAFDQDTLNGW